VERDGRVASEGMGGMEGGNGGLGAAAAAAAAWERGKVRSYLAQ
jgi:hypothetical protein